MTVRAIIHLLAFFMVNRYMGATFLTW